MADVKIKLSKSEFAPIYNNKPDFDILNFDFFNNGAGATLIPDKDDDLLKKLKAYQRLLRLEPDESIAHTLFKNNIRSAQQIASFNQNQFVNNFGEMFGENGKDKAKQIHLKAESIKSRTMHLRANLHSINSPHYQSLRVNKANNDSADQAENLPNYQELFDSLDYQETDENSSIFGPSAYLVDLLRIIEKHITNKTENIPVGYKLNDRRPDLAKIPLTSAKTNDTVPYLQIVNEVLAKTVSTSTTSNDADQVMANSKQPFNLPLERIRTYLSNHKTSLAEIFKVLDLKSSQNKDIDFAREYIGLSIEENKNITQVIANLKENIANNFGFTKANIKKNLPNLDPLHVLMQQTGLSRNDITDLFHQGLSNCELFNISGEYTSEEKGTKIQFIQNMNEVIVKYGQDYEFVTKAVLCGKKLKGSLVGVEKDEDPPIYFVFTFCSDGSGFRGNYKTKNNKTCDWNGKRNSTNPPIGGKIPNKLFINSVILKNDFLSVDTDDANKINNLNPKTKDTINRFVRLSKKLGWAYSDLSWVLLSLGNKIDNETIIELAKIKKLKDEYKLPLDLLTTLWFNIKTIGVGNGATSEAQFDLIFNNTNVNKEKYYPKESSGEPSDYVSPLYSHATINWQLNIDSSINPGENEDDTNQQKANTVISSIPAAKNDVIAIAKALKLDNNGGDKIPLTVKNLSALYRHAAFAKQVNMHVADYLVLLKLLAYQIKEKSDQDLTIVEILDRDQTLKIVETLAWMKKTAITVYDIDYICKGTPSAYVHSGYDVKNIPSLLKSLQHLIKSFLLKQDDFVGNGIDKDTSGKCYSLIFNKGYIDNSGLILKDINVNNFTKINTEQKIKLTDDQINHIVSVVSKRKQEQSKKFADQFGAFFGVKVDLMESLLDGLAKTTNNYLQTLLHPVSFSSNFLYCSTLDLAKINEEFKKEEIKNDNIPLFKNVESKGNNSWTITDGADTCYCAITDDIAFSSNTNISFTDKLLGILKSTDKNTNIKGFIVQYEKKIWFVESDTTKDTNRNIEIKTTDVNINKTIVINSEKKVTIDDKDVENPDKSILIGNLVFTTKAVDVLTLDQNKLPNLFKNNFIDLTGTPTVKLDDKDENIWIITDTDNNKTQYRAIKRDNDIYFYKPTDLFTVSSADVLNNGTLDNSKLQKQQELLTIKDKVSNLKGYTVQYNHKNWAVESDNTEKTGDNNGTTRTIELKSEDGKKGKIIVKDSKTVIATIDNQTIDVPNSSILFSLIPPSDHIEVISLNEYTWIFSDSKRLYYAVQLNKEIIFYDCLSITNFIQTLSQYLKLAKHLNLTNSELNSIFLNPTAFNIDSNTKDKDLELNIKSIHTIHTFKQMILDFEDKKEGLVNYLNQGEKSTQKMLCAVTGWNKEQIMMLLNKGYNRNSVNGIYQTKQIFDICKKLTTDVHFLQQLNLLKTKDASDGNWQFYTNLADTLLQTVKNRNTSEAWPTVSKKINGSIEAKRRDALVGMAIHKLKDIKVNKEPKIKNSRDLYDYLLIDVDMAPCAEISYIKQALNSAQLYLQRCRLNLEPCASTEHIPEVYWEWIMNYRVWEANRKVFLYPENYIDPSLRKNASPLYEKLKNDLMQGKITDEKVTEAYHDYFDGFAEVANLKIVGSYACKVDHADTYQTIFLVGRSRKEPYQFYYRTAEISEAKNSITNSYVAPSLTDSSPWTKIDMHINSEMVSPIFAFNKLFIFWVEIKPAASKRDDKEKDTIKQFEAQINYSFYNFNKNWVAPQKCGASISLPKYIDSKEKTDDIKWQKIWLYLDINQIIVDYNGINNKPIVINHDLTSASNFSIDLPVNFPIPKINISNGIIPSNIVVNGSSLQHVNNRFGLPYAIQFDGKTNFLETKNEIGSTDEFTFSAWILFSGDNDNTDGAVITSTDAKCSFGCTAMAGGIDFLIDGLPDKLHKEIKNGFAKIWVHLAAVVSAKKVKIYFNGKEDKNNEKNLDKPITINSKFNIGLYNKTMYFKGKMDEVFIFDKALTDNEIKLLATPPSLPKPIVNISRGIIPSSVVVNDPSLQYVNNRIGLPYAIQFDGKKNFLETKNKIGPTNEFTFSAWIYFSDDTIGPVIITNDSQYYIYCSPKKGGIDFRNAAYNDVICHGEILRGFLKEWVHLATVVSSGEIIIYFNGERLTAKGNYSQDKPFGPVTINSKIDIGLYYKNDTKNYFIGRMDEVFIFDKALTHNQIKILATCATGIEYTTTLPGSDVLTALLDTTKGYPVAGTLDKFIMDTGKSEYLGIENNDNYDFLRINSTSVHDLSSKLFAEGVDGLLTLDVQNTPEDSFNDLGPTTKVNTQPSDSLDFKGLNGLYFKEIFFHIPFLIANHLNANQQFDQATKWYQYIFNPTRKSDYWQFLPFTYKTGLLTSIKRDLNLVGFTVKYDNKFWTVTDDKTKEKTKEKKRTITIKPKDGTDITMPTTIVVTTSSDNKVLVTIDEKIFGGNANSDILVVNLLEKLIDMLKPLPNPEITAYENDPFDPEAIADLRIGAYEKVIVMKYIDNLLDQGDYFFSQYTWETITTAYMLYVYAYDLLGPKPKDMGKKKISDQKTFDDISGKYGKDDPFLIKLEHTVGSSAVMTTSNKAFNDIDSYFSIPENEQFTAYWDRVQDRIYKIRHCLNIDGKAQKLPLFQPPINPEQLVKAAASSNNVLDVTKHLQPDIPYYRFNYMLERAKNITSTLTQLGSSLLSALEKNDAESLALLRSTHEGNILNMTTMIKQKQIEDLQKQHDSLNANQGSAQNRVDYYTKLSGEFMNPLEIADVNLRKGAIVPQSIAAGLQAVSIVGHLEPRIFGVADGGMQFGEAINAGAQVSDSIANILNQSAGIVSTMAQYQRRHEDWQLQEQTANYEVTQITSQMDANTIQQEISKHDLAIHQKQIDQYNEEEAFLKNKFTNRELYQWMLNRLSTIYFQTYKIALDMALSAQAAYQFELNRSDTPITFNCWDSLHKGLLAGESLMLSLNQLEKSYIENNVRDLEIEKTISVQNEFFEEFIHFKYNKNGKKGQLSFDLKQQLFDHDFPGHYCRKIKSISISIPAIVGPYQNINATLTQTTNSVMLKPDTDTVNFLNKPKNGTSPSSNTLRQNWVPNQQIAISRGIEDSGMFALDFRDERYLPFEGTGAVSSWILNMPPETNHINFDTISDVIVKIKYTAIDGGNAFRDKVKEININNKSEMKHLKFKSFDLSQAFPDAWKKMVTADTTPKTIEFSVTDNIYLPNLEKITLHNVLLQLEFEDSSVASGDAKLTTQKRTDSSASSIPAKQNHEEETLSAKELPDPVNITIADNFGETSQNDKLSKLQIDNNHTWSLDLSDLNELDINKLKNIILVVVYGSTT